MLKFSLTLPPCKHRLVFNFTDLVFCHLQCILGYTLLCATNSDTVCIIFVLCCYPNQNTGRSHLNCPCVLALWKLAFYLLLQMLANQDEAMIWNTSGKKAFISSFLASHSLCGMVFLPKTVLNLHHSMNARHFSGWINLVWVITKQLRMMVLFWTGIGPGACWAQLLGALCWQMYTQRAVLLKSLVLQDSFPNNMGILQTETIKHQRRRVSKWRYIRSEVRSPQILFLFLD